MGCTKYAVVEHDVDLVQSAKPLLVLA